MAHSSLEELIKLAGALGLGYGGKVAVEWWLARQAGVDQRKAKATGDPAQIIAAGADFQEKLVEAAKDLLQDYRDQLTFVRGQCAELETARELDRERIARLEREVADTSAELARSMMAHSNCQEELAGMRAQIEALMAERVQTEPVPIGRPAGQAVAKLRRRRSRPAKGLQS